MWPYESEASSLRAKFEGGGISYYCKICDQEISYNNAPCKLCEEKIYYKQKYPHLAFTICSNNLYCDDAPCPKCGGEYGTPMLASQLDLDFPANTVGASSTANYINYQCCKCNPSVELRKFRFTRGVWELKKIGHKCFRCSEIFWQPNNSKHRNDKWPSDGEFLCENCDPSTELQIFTFYEWIHEWRLTKTGRRCDLCARIMWLQEPKLPYNFSATSKKSPQWPDLIRCHECSKKKYPLDTLHIKFKCSRKNSFPFGYDVRCIKRYNPASKRHYMDSNRSAIDEMLSRAADTSGGGGPEKILKYRCPCDKCLEI